MNVTQWPPLTNSQSLYRLKREINTFDPLPGNMWMGIHDIPENTIEKYILDSYSLVFGNKYHQATGFEWWFHKFTEDDRMIRFHSDHDEMIRRETGGEMRYPLISTVTYVNNHVSPTIIFDSMTGKYEKELISCPPREVLFSIPEEGRFLAFDPRYIHGVLPGSKDRITLMYNVWDYKPDGLNRIGIRTAIDDTQFFVGREDYGRGPTIWLGDCSKATVDCMGMDVTFKHPQSTHEGEFWSTIND